VAAAQSCPLTTTTDVFEPLQDEFMRRAILELTLLGLAGGALGCWVVLYELSYAAESLAHSIFPGLVLAAIAGVPLLLGAVPAIAVAALAIALLTRLPGVSRDVGVAVVVTTMFGLGVLLALSPDSPPGVESLLFGDIFGPTDADLIAAAALVAVLIVALPLLHGRLLAAGFDRGSARALGFSAVRLDAALLILLAAAIVVAVQGFGNLLVVAVFVGPAATARNLSDRIGSMIAIAAAAAVLAGVAGLYLSYYAGTAGGASVALAILALYLLSLPLGRWRSARPRERSLAEATIV
jgi:ABC-type Mn2+/Zn2+ transport system permease subunit